MRKNVLPLLQNVAFWFLEACSKDAIVYMDYFGRTTVLPSDVVSALKRQGRDLVIFTN